MFEIGSSLREARLRRGIDIVQAEGGTKIRGKYLRALEEERFGQLPADTYIKGFLRTYAEYLGLDGQLYVDEYNSRFVVGEDHESRARRSAARAKSTRRLQRNVLVVVLVAVAITLLVVLITAWGSSGTGTKTPPPRPAARHRVVAPTPGAYLTIKAVSGSSYVAVHRTGPNGAILFQGTIGRGHVEPFEGKRFWLNISSPENLVITVGGRVVNLPGLEPRVLTVTPGGWHTG